MTVNVPRRRFRPARRLRRARVPSLALALAGAALLASAPPRDPVPAEGAVGAAALLAGLGDCRPLSQGHYRSDRGARADIPVCGTREVVFWKADMDIDCDGRSGTRCNRRTDPSFQPATAFRQSDGRYLDAETLPYVVVPGPSRIWDYRAHGIRGGSVVAVVHQGRVRYAVVGDTGPTDIIGEASYATARALGLSPDPRSGGAAGGVTYIVFKNSRVTPIEDHRQAAEQGEALARAFLRGG
ncbi:glycoside hydrolase family 75 protein [Streptomyces sp. CRN 30]|uniref:glycoside hydrolase family 75 protein n=1 Tax=Streptomyces sp. CRN 30 TaxID=3075613 RepID=UPI002A82272E|nr:glycoside hydrolase family 75 protein [Streptomyces sp. CRN 30]